MDPVGRLDGLPSVVPTGDLPAVIVDLVVAAPAQRQQVVEVGATSASERVHVMGLDLERVGLIAAGTAPVQRHERLELRLGGAPDVAALPHGHAVGAEHQREPRRPAGQPLSHRGGKRIAVSG